MKIKSALCCVTLLSACFTASSAIADDRKLQQQIESLVQRVDVLEKRLNALEGETELAVEQSKANAAPQNPGDARDLSNWARLHGGLNYDEVRTLIGEPDSIKKGLHSEAFFH